MPFLDLPPQIQERVVCSITAAVKYEVPANIVLAVAEQEGGKPGQWVRNTNGTHDVGPMQFNTAYLVELRQYGITPQDVARGGCYSYDLAAWRLRGHLRNDQGDIWTRAANYHSRTPQYNAVYRTSLIKRAGKWENWLVARFPTFDTIQASKPVMEANTTPRVKVEMPRSSVVNTSMPIGHYNAAAADALEAVFGQKDLRRE
ncbi:lysozyme family protein [Xylella fastidiosa]|uniref:conjugal transfer protein TrbN n=1 Tax=Xylella fastidiosa TaxID=2371 RepID=UPI00111FE28E|nr:conjugal transfer protein TrbN [Xylella fastidiosa]TNW18312.1 conjugal transfer protein TrbN [Xylella fastidiosa subsp. pauca]TNW24322.1 conjugal transfer protein TrbN [Xylella fastidiosa subsp. pauca]